MNFKKICLVVFLLSVCAASPVMFSNEAIAQQPEKLVFTAGPAGGAWYGLAGAVSELIKKKYPDLVVTVIPGGGVGNPSVVDKGKAQLGLSISHLYKSAMTGKDPYTGEHKNIRALLQLGTSDMGIFLVKEDIGLNSIDDVKKKKFPLRLTTTSKASTPALAALRLLGEYGVTFDDLKAWGGSVTFTSYADAASLISDGHADAIIAVSVPAVHELVQKVKMKWLAPEEAIVEKMVEKYGYSKNAVPKGAYPWAAEDSWTIGEPNIIIAATDIPEKVAYTITKAICESPETIRNFGTHYKDFDAKSAWKNLGGPMHPGAEKFFREAGYMKSLSCTYCTDAAL